MSNESPNVEIQRTRSYANALEELLVTYEKTAIEQSHKLQEANEKLRQEIAEKIIAQNDLSRSEEMFRLIFEEAPVGMLIVNSDYKIIRTNKAICKILGYREDELTLKTFDDITHEQDKEETARLASKLFGGMIHSFQIEKRYVKKDGGICWVNLLATTFKDKSDELLGLGMIADITDRLYAEKRIRQLAFYDSLTGLPNRTFFKELIGRSLSYAHRYKTTLAVLFLDLDNFKRINDTLGHDSGDRLLKEVTERLQRAMRSSDHIARFYEIGDENIVSRLGGDEFVIVLHNMSNAQHSSIVAKRVLEDISCPIALEGQEIYVTGSIGISIYPDDGKDTDTLLKNADTAMYYAKAGGRNKWQFFAKSMNEKALEAFNLEVKLRKAIDRKEFTIFYQPIINIKTGTISGVEALVRWHDPEAGLMFPDKFIPLAEETGLIVPIGEIVLNGACDQSRKWRESGFMRLYVSVNLSARQFRQENLAEVVSNALEKSGLPAESLRIEITESAVMNDPVKAAETLNFLKNMGIRISLDDFGTGYSSLNYLHSIPIDSIKIDKSFVASMLTNKKDASIVKTIISLSHSIGLKVTAEGVENEMQVELLTEHECDEMQGYLFSRPLPAEEVVKCFSMTFTRTKET